jgi:ubiquinone/menaquinone biosynthesis C-methylase UbiE
MDVLEEALKLDDSRVIADIGSGTGISSLPFLQKGYTVQAVEPNKEMREAAEQMLSDFPNFRSVNGAAEETNLPDNSVDLVFCAQAFHWFDKEKCKKEFNRILTENGHIVLAWNDRNMNSGFQQEYEQLLYDNLDEYKFVNHRNISEEIVEAFFAPKAMNKIILQNSQTFDFSGLAGRLRSSSYFPKSGEKYDELMATMKDIFDKYQRNNTIIFEYDTKIYWC